MPLDAMGVYEQFPAGVMKTGNADDAFIMLLSVFDDFFDSRPKYQIVAKSVYEHKGYRNI